MTILLEAEVKFPYASGTPADEVINTFWFAVPGVDPTAEFTDIADALTAFYTHSPGGGAHDHAIADYFPGYLALDSGNIACITTFKLVDEATGVRSAEPIFAPGVPTITPDPISEFGLPAEVSLCLSFKAHPDTAPDTPARRKRGRIYIGPISGGVESYTVTDYMRPTTYIMNSLIQAAVALKAVLDTAGHGVQWVIYSRPVSAAQAAEILEDNPSTTVTARDGLAIPVEHAWVDNEWDTQRRRGMDNTARQDQDL